MHSLGSHRDIHSRLPSRRRRTHGPWRHGSHGMLPSGRLRRYDRGERIGTEDVQRPSDPSPRPHVRIGMPRSRTHVVPHPSHAHHRLRLGHRRGLRPPVLSPLLHRRIVRYHDGTERKGDGEQCDAIVPEGRGVRIVRIVRRRGEGRRTGPRRFVDTTLRTEDGLLVVHALLDPVRDALRFDGTDGRGRSEGRPWEGAGGGDTDWKGVTCSPPTAFSYAVLPKMSALRQCVRS
mmetsp:Transcript_46713/g.141536  ORF Transcript_46713/g.141536 Transcript_46713/m.141536 type:complete len:233 (+) Transcript_46713:361-1059(+)